MAIPYQSPGISITEETSPALAPIILTPSTICIVAPAEGHESASERVILVGESPIALAHTGLSLSSVQVVNSSGQVVNKGAYKVEQGADPNTSIVGDEPFTIVRRYHPTQALTAAATGTGTLTGSYKYAYSFVNADGETGLSPASTTVNPAGQGNNLTNVLVGPTGTTARNIYRAPVVAGVTGTFRLVASIADNATTTLSNESMSDVSWANQPEAKVGVGVITARTTTSGSHITPISNGTLNVVSTTGFTTAGTIVVGTTVLTYTGVTATSFTGVNGGESGTISTATEVYQGSPETVVVSYDYTDASYFEPTLLNDFDDIVQKYGEPFDADGGIYSKLTLAAQFAFLNGSSEILALAVESDNASGFDKAFDKLLSEEGVRLIVAISGDDLIHSLLRNHLNEAAAMGLYRQGISGKDGSNSVITAEQLRAAARALNNEGMMLISPTSFQIINPVTAREYNIGGQFVAAIIAGMIAARDVQIPLTRKVVSGIFRIKDKRNQSDAALDSANGLLVIEEKNGQFRIRHGLSTRVDTVNTREANVVRAKYEMAHRVRQGLDETVIGNVAPSGEAASLVQSTVVGILDQLVSEEAIASHGAVSARLLTLDPTHVEVKFGYVPMYSINRVDVRFVIDTQGGALQLTSNEAGLDLSDEEALDII